MSPAPDNFDPLKTLLAWKRYEQPPPGFFVSFPDLVGRRIQQASQTAPASWWNRWLAELDPQPMLAGAYCIAVCGLLLSGISLSRIFDEKPGSGRLVNDALVGASLAADLASEVTDPALGMPSAVSAYPAVHAFFNNEPPSFLFETPQMRAHPVDFRFNTP